MPPASSPGWEHPKSLLVPCAWQCCGEEGEAPLPQQGLRAQPAPHPYPGYVSSPPRESMWVLTMPSAKPWDAGRPGVPAPAPAVPTSPPSSVRRARPSATSSPRPLHGRRDGRPDRWTAGWALRSAFINCVGSSAQPSRPLSACRTLALKGHRAPANTTGAAKLRRGELCEMSPCCAPKPGDTELEPGLSSGTGCPAAPAALGQWQPRCQAHRHSRGHRAARTAPCGLRGCPRGPGEGAEGGRALVPAPSVLPGTQSTSDTCRGSGGVKTP